MPPKRIAFYGNFGSGNLGNECTLQVVLEHVRRCWPDTQLSCICAVPDDVRSRHNIAATRAALCACEWTPARVNDTTPVRPPHPPSARGAPQFVRKALHVTFARLPRELAHWTNSFMILRHADMLVIPGTQIVSDYLCGPMGWPYDIFRWSMLAALCRVKLVYLSIGVGPLHHPVSRWFVRNSLKTARYCSYRDEHSRRYAESLGVRADPNAVYPDLAFGLSHGHLAVSHRPAGPTRVVGLGLKDYRGPAHETTAGAYMAYLHKMADFVSWLHGRQYGVRLLIGDLQYDLQPRRDFLQILAQRGIATEPPLLAADDPRTVDELMLQIRATDVVVSPRMHNLILAVLIERPVIALSDHTKLDSLLTGLDLTHYRVPLDELSVDALVERFVHLEHNAERLKRRLRVETDRRRCALQEQYARVFCTAEDAA